MFFRSWLKAWRYFVAECQPQRATVRYDLIIFMKYWCNTFQQTTFVSNICARVSWLSIDASLHWPDWGKISLICLLELARLHTTIVCATFANTIWLVIGVEDTWWTARTSKGQLKWLTGNLLVVQVCSCSCWIVDSSMAGKARQNRDELEARMIGVTRE